MILISCSGTQSNLVIEDFESEGAWRGLLRSTQEARDGRFSGEWAHLHAERSIRLLDIPKDWSAYDRLAFWLYSRNAVGLVLTIVVNSENKEDLSGWDYYSSRLMVDWEGWKHISLDFNEDIRPTRHPRGWHQVDAFEIHAYGTDLVPSDAALYFDEMRLARDDVRLRSTAREVGRGEDGSAQVQYALEIANETGRPKTIGLSAHRIIDAGSSRSAFRLTEVPATVGPIAPKASMVVPITLSAEPADLEQAEPLSQETFEVRLESVNGSTDFPRQAVRLVATAPLPERSHPFLFGDSSMFLAALDRAQKHAWAGRQFDSLLEAADEAVGEDLTVPEEGGQWFHHYVCKQDGFALQYKAGKHVCPKDGREYSGWPYDQVITARKHHANWAALRTLGLAYALTSKEVYARTARDLLLEYAAKYPAMVLHDSEGAEDPKPGAGRVFSSSLAEARHIIGVAWAYDLIFNSPSLSDDDRDRIERSFLREVVVTLRKNQASRYNEWAWHNAAFAAIGFCLEDEEIASIALDEWSGLEFQFAHGIANDGFWWEATPNYHYYALDAMRWTTEAAYYAGIDFYDEAKYKSMFDAPLEYAFPDRHLPATNDSYLSSLDEYRPLYEIAYSRFLDPSYSIFLSSGQRGSLEALLWGVDKADKMHDVAQRSKVFPGIGAVVLRQGKGKDAIYAHLDYGPHGGGHGHFDKLAMILFGLGRQLAPDPGTTMYGSPLRQAWFEETFAHNTVVVDGKSQNPAAGKLTLFHSQPGLTIAGARSAEAYPGVLLERTLALTPDYLVDVFKATSDQEHVYDWVYHNLGELTPGMPTKAFEKPLGLVDGYELMTEIEKATTSDAWTAEFVLQGAKVRVTMLGRPDSSLYFGNGIGNSDGDHIAARTPTSVPMIVVRRKAKETTFVSVIEPYRRDPTVKGLAAVDMPGDRGPAFEITRSDGKVERIVLADPRLRQNDTVGVRSTVAQ